MEGKSQDTAGEPEKGDFTKPQTPTERKVSVGYTFTELHRSKLEVEIIPLSFIHCEGKPG